MRKSVKAAGVMVTVTLKPGSHQVYRKERPMKPKRDHRDAGERGEVTGGDREIGLKGKGKRKPMAY